MPEKPVMKRNSRNIGLAQERRHSLGWIVPRQPSRFLCACPALDAQAQACLMLGLLFRGCQFEDKVKI